MSALVNRLRLVHADEVAPMAWKNGGGVTRELLRVPLPGARADDWLLRISLADIEADGPFSPFDGVTRWFAVLSGRGVDLRWPAAGAEPMRRRIAVDSAPLAFDGANAPDCRLVDGPTRDLNVMVRDGAARATVERAALGVARRREGRALGVFALRPLALARGGERIALRTHTLAWCDGADTAAWSLAPSPEAGGAIAETGDGAPPAFWIGLALRDRDASSTLPTTA